MRYKVSLNNIMLIFLLMTSVLSCACSRIYYTEQLDSEIAIQVTEDMIIDYEGLEMDYYQTMLNVDDRDKIYLQVTAGSAIEAYRTALIEFKLQAAVAVDSGYLPVKYNYYYNQASDKRRLAHMYLSLIKSKLKSLPDQEEDADDATDGDTDTDE